MIMIMMMITDDNDGDNKDNMKWQLADAPFLLQLPIHLVLAVSLGCQP